MTAFEEVAFDANLPEARMLLRQAKKAFNDARKSPKTDAPRQ